MEIPTKLQNNPFKYIRRVIMDSLLLAFQSEWIFEDDVRKNKFKVVIDSMDTKEDQDSSFLMITERGDQNSLITDKKSLIVVGRGAVQSERLSQHGGFSGSDGGTLRDLATKKDFSKNIRYTTRLEIKTMTKTDTDDLAFAVWYILGFFQEKIRIAAGLTFIGEPVIGEIMPENMPGQQSETRVFTCAVEMPMQFGINYTVWTTNQEEEWQVIIANINDES